MQEEAAVELTTVLSCKPADLDFIRAAH